MKSPIEAIPTARSVKEHHPSAAAIVIPAIASVLFLACSADPLRASEYDVLPANPSASTRTMAEELTGLDDPLVYAPGALQLREGEQVSNRGLALSMQTDGNLVLYDASGRPLWSSNTYHQCT